MSDEFDYYKDDPDAPCEYCGVQDDHKDWCPTRPWNACSGCGNASYDCACNKKETTVHTKHQLEQYARLARSRRHVERRNTCAECGCEQYHKMWCSHSELYQPAVIKNPNRSYTYYEFTPDPQWPSYAVVPWKMRYFDHTGAFSNRVTFDGSVGPAIRDGGGWLLAPGSITVYLNADRIDGVIRFRLWYERFYTCGYACKGYDKPELLWEADIDDMPGATDVQREKRFYLLTEALGGAINDGCSVDQLQIIISNFVAGYELDDARFPKPWIRWA